MASCGVVSLAILVCCCLGSQAVVSTSVPLTVLSTTSAVPPNTSAELSATSYSAVHPTASAPPSTTSAVHPTASAPPSTVPLTISAVPSTTVAPPSNEDLDNLSFELVIKLMKENPIITGLSVAVVILSILLTCMCCLWVFKRRKSVLYEIVDLSQMKSDSEVDGETLDNPWATDGPSTANTDQHCNGNGVTELKVTQTTGTGSDMILVDHDQETSLSADGMQPDTQETVVNESYEEIPSHNAMSIDWTVGGQDVGNIMDLPLT